MKEKLEFAGEFSLKYENGYVEFKPHRFLLTSKIEK